MKLVISYNDEKWHESMENPGDVPEFKHLSYHAKHRRVNAIAQQVFRRPQSQRLKSRWNEHTVRVNLSSVSFIRYSPDGVNTSR